MHPLSKVPIPACGRAVLYSEAVFRGHGAEGLTLPEDPQGHEKLAHDNLPGRQGGEEEKARQHVLTRLLSSPVPGGTQGIVSQGWLAAACHCPLGQLRYKQGGGGTSKGPFSGDAILWYWNQRGVVPSSATD